MERALRTFGDVASLGELAKGGALLVAFSKFGLGHVARCSKIAHCVCRTGLPSVVVSSQPEYFHSWPSRDLQCVSLPGYMYDSSEPPSGIPCRSLGSTVFGMSSEETLYVRRKLLVELARVLQPRVVYVDAYPFHPDKSEEECGDLFRFLRRALPGTLRLSGFRGEMSRTHPPAVERRIIQLTERDIHRLFVFVDPSERSAIEARYRFLRRLCGRVSYAGYVLPSLAADLENEPRKPGLWIATVGGGVDGYERLCYFCETAKALRGLGRKGKLLVATGRRLPATLAKRLRSRFEEDDQIEFHEVLPDYLRLLRQAELIFCMCGYNTCTELLLSRARVVCCPRKTSDNEEQWLRARKFKDYGVIDIVREAEAFEPRQVARDVSALLGADRPLAVDVKRSGGEAIARFVAAFVGRAV